MFIFISSTNVFMFIIVLCIAYFGIFRKNRNKIDIDNISSGKKKAKITFYLDKMFEFLMCSILGYLLALLRR